MNRITGWYSGQLLQHGETILSQASKLFTPYGVEVAGTRRGVLCCSNIRLIIVGMCAQLRCLVFIGGTARTRMQLRQQQAITTLTKSMVT
jgi:hypothetical protein